MLLVKLRKNDCLTIGPVVVQVRTASDNMLRLAIEAPRDMKINHARAGQIVLGTETVPHAADERPGDTTPLQFPSDLVQGDE